MQKKLPVTKLILYILAVFLAGILLMFTQLLFPLAQSGDPQQQGGESYHVQVITGDAQSYFTSQFMEGALQAGQDLSTYVEFISMPRWGEKTLKELVERSAYAGVDGVAIRTNEPELVEDLNLLAQSRNMELTLYESENPQSLQIPMVGSNSYSIGMAAGQLAINASGGNCRVLLVLDSGEQSGGGPYPNMKLQGILELFGRYSRTDVVSTYTLGSELFAAENLVDNILKGPRDFDMIICLQESSTPLLAQRIIDNNLLGEITIIGYGAMEDTLDYINRNVIYGVVCPDAYDIGYHTVMQLTAAVQNDTVNEYSSTNLHSITKENIEDFLLE